MITGKKMSLQEKAVRKALIDHDMTIGDLAKRLNISQSYCYDIITGARKAERVRIGINSVLGVRIADYDRD